jgi:hypothetical protein
VIVALGASDGQAEPGLSQGVHAVDHGFRPELFGLDSAFLIHHGIAEKTGGDALVESRVGEQVARQLLDGELVKGNCSGRS